MTLFDKIPSAPGLPMHMPGHKRNARAFPWLSGLCERDITEIEGFDNLNDPEAEFARMERDAARLWGAGESVALVGGSTLGILASVLSVLAEGGELLMCRQSHRSVYHAAQLAGVRTRYLTPEPDPVTGVPLSVSRSSVAAALDKYPQIRLVCVTSPTYEGVLSDIRAIAELCHRRGVPLLVDEAHGAHLGFGGFPESAVRCGADLTVQSLHKTLPSLTQTALLHLNPGLVDPGRVRRTVGMLQSSSPSYLLSGSIEKCVEFMGLHGREACDRWLELLSDFRAGAEGLAPVRLWKGSGAYALDPSKLLFMADPALAEKLRARGIEPEYARGGLTLCMTGLGDTRESLGALLAALEAAGGELPPPEPRPVRPVPLPEAVMTLREAMALPGEPVPWDKALGRVSGEYAWAYPPGIPCLVPGEMVDGGVLETLRTARDLLFTYKHGSGTIFCVDLPGKMV